MPDAVALQKIIDGPYKSVYKFTNVSDGTGETNVVKLTAATEGCRSFAIDAIEYATVGMGVDIFFGATTNQLAISLPQDVTDTLDFMDIGSMPDPKATGWDGTIRFSTVAAALGDRYTVILTVRKFLS